MGKSNEARLAGAPAAKPKGKGFAPKPAPKPVGKGGAKPAPKVSLNLADPKNVAKLAAKKPAKPVAAPKPKPAAVVKPKSAAPAKPVAAPKKPAAPVSTVTPLPVKAAPVKPAVNVFALMLETWELWKAAPAEKKTAGTASFPVPIGCVIGYGRGWVIPRDGAAEMLTQLRGWLKGEPEKAADPEPVAAPVVVAPVVVTETVITESGPGVLGSEATVFPLHPVAAAEPLAAELYTVPVTPAVALGEPVPEAVAEPADCTPDGYPVSVKLVDEGGADRDIVDDTEGSVVDNLKAAAETLCVPEPAPTADEIEAKRSGPDILADTAYPDTDVDV